MAFSSQSRSANNANNDASWKAAGFVNIRIKTKSGSAKLIAIPLKESDPFLSAIYKKLSEGGDEAMQSFVNALEFDFQHSKTRNADDLTF